MLEKICALAREAGKAILPLYYNQEKISLDYKQDHSPVTGADFVAHHIIFDGLSSLFPDIPVLSEEGLIDWSIRQHWQCYWCVDPLDGTKEFLKKNDQFTVNIALIESGKPTLGVIYAPVFDALYYGYQGEAYKIDELGLQKIFVKNHVPPRVIMGHFQKQGHSLSHYLSTLGDYQTIRLGSSLKFCFIAEGQAQIYPRFSGIHIWDTAAGQAIAEAAGASVIDWQGNPLNYQPRASFLNPAFCVLSDKKYLTEPLPNE